MRDESRQDAATERAEFLVQHGWHTWYNHDFWVSPQRVVDPKAQDYTSYGMTLDDAYDWQVNGGKPVPYIGDLAAAFRALPVPSQPSPVEVVTDCHQLPSPAEPITVADVYLYEAVEGNMDEMEKVKAQWAAPSELEQATLTLQLFMRQRGTVYLNEEVKIAAGVVLEAAQPSTAMEVDNNQDRIATLETHSSDLEQERDEARAVADRESYVVDRVWQALGVKVYADARGKTVWELVQELRESGVGEREQAIRECAAMALSTANGDPYSDYDSGVQADTDAVSSMLNLSPKYEGR